MTTPPPAADAAPAPTLSVAPPAPTPAPHNGSDVAVGVVICVLANLSMSLGTNVLKLAFSRRQRTLEELQAAAASASDGGEGAPPAKLPPVYKSRIWLVRSAYPSIARCARCATRAAARWRCARTRFWLPRI